MKVRRKIRRTHSHILLLLCLVVALPVLTGCETTGSRYGDHSEDDIPGISTMRKYGTRMDPHHVLDVIGNIMREFSGGRAAAAIYDAVIDRRYDAEVFIIDSIAYDDNELAVDIQGHVERVSTYREFVAKGGLGIPVYEAKEPNEFGVIFGRQGDVAVRDGVVVRRNPLAHIEIYELEMGSETYDKVVKAPMLFQTYAAIRTPFLKNAIIELQGMLLNSSSREAVLDGIRQYKAEHPDLNEEEVMVGFLEANQSYLNELESSDEEAEQRIKDGHKLVRAIRSACGLQVVELTKHFAVMTADIALIISEGNPLNIASAAMRYIARNVPDRHRGFTLTDARNVREYSKYRMEVYQRAKAENEELDKRVQELIDQL